MIFLHAFCFQRVFFGQKTRPVVNVRYDDNYPWNRVSERCVWCWIPEKCPKRQYYVIPGKGQNGRIWDQTSIGTSRGPITVSSSAVFGGHVHALHNDKRRLSASRSAIVALDFHYHTSCCDQQTPYTMIDFNFSFSTSTWYRDNT